MSEIKELLADLNLEVEAKKQLIELILWQSDEIKRINRHVGALLHAIGGKSFRVINGETVISVNDEEE